MKKLIVILLIILFITRMFYISHYDIDTNRGSYLSGYGASLIPIDNGNIKIEFSVVGTGRMDMIGVSVIQVYKSDGTLVATYAYGDNESGNMMGYDTGRHSGYVSYSGRPGQSYYAVVTYFAENGNGEYFKKYTTPKITA